METIKIEGTVYFDTKKYCDGFHFFSIPFDSTFWDNRSDLFKVAPYTIEIELNGDINKMIYDKTLASLQQQRKLILAENQTKLNEIDARISEHLAIENKS